MKAQKSIFPRNPFQTLTPGSASADEIGRIRSKKLNALLAAAKRAPIYRKRLNFDPNDLGADGLGSLPWLFTTLPERARRQDEFSAAAGDAAFETPGPHGEELAARATWAGIEPVVRFVGHMLYRAGLGPGDRFLNAYDFSYSGLGILHQRICERMGAFCVPAGMVAATQLFPRLAPYRITALMGHPTLLIELTRLAEKEGAAPLRGIFMTSERIPDDIRAWMEEVWRCKVYMGFGVPGVYPAVAMETKGADGFFLNALAYDAQTGQAADGGPKNEILITPLDAHCQPTLRLATQTTGRIEVAEIGSEGAPPLPKLADLQDAPGDWLFVGDCFISAGATTAAIGKTAPGSNPRLSVRWIDRRKTLTVAVDKAPDAAAIREAILASAPNLAQRVKLGMADIEIEAPAAPPAPAEADENPKGDA